MVKKWLFSAALVSVVLLSGCCLKHEYAQWSVKVESTCTSEGVDVQLCAKCGKEGETRPSAMAPHALEEWKIEKEATCTEEGTKTRGCKDCDYSENAIIAKKKHEYGNWKETKKPTCDNTGSRERVCAVCQYVNTETVAANGHKWKSATCTVAKTCTVCKQTNGAPAGHRWSNATCTQAKKCSVCGITSGGALGHSKNTSGKCTRCGQIVSVDMKTLIGKPISESRYLCFSYYKNTADGIKLFWQAKNNSGKTIKYLTVKIYFENRVEDPAYDSITKKSEKTVKLVGPFNPGGTITILDIVGYVPTCHRVLLGEMTAEYTDGTGDTGWYGYYTEYDNKFLK